jgi:pyruvate,water dikinase
MDLVTPDERFVLPFSRIGRQSLLVAGGKAANLGELTRAGFPVPAGFCVTTAAYMEVAAGSRIAPLLDELAATPPADAQRLSSLACRARQALLDAPVPDSVQRACLQAYRALGGDIPVAVRSSATAEDLPDASFAGQQDTYLHTVGEASVLDAIRRCWASLWTDRAVFYRAGHGIDPRGVALAVAVQRMVEATVAGVLFTANPLSGRRRQAVIDASRGLGEAVVSGRVNPDHFEVLTGSGEITMRRIGDKKISIEPVEGGGTREVPVAGGSSAACLSDDTVRQLAALGDRVEAHYQAPQDIEWAIDGAGETWLVQARPITTLFPMPDKPPGSGDELRVYLNFNVAQGVFRPLTPMGIQCWRMLASGLAIRAGLKVPEPERGPAIISSAGHRMLLDLTELIKNPLGRRLLDFAFRRMEARSAAIVEQLRQHPEFQLKPFSRARLGRRVLSALARTRIPLSIVRAAFSPAAARARGDRVGHEVLAWGSTGSDAGPEARIDAIDRLLVQGVSRVFLTVMPSLMTGMLCFLIAKRCLRGLSTNVENDTVLRALPHNVTTEMDLSLWRLAERLGRDPEARRILSETPAGELAAQYQASTLAPSIANGLAEFLQRYGARGVAEIDVGVARWGEDPTHILGSIANYLALDDGADGPEAQFDKGRREAEAMVDTLTRRARAAGRLRGWIVGFTLGRTRALAGVRESPKFYAVGIFARIRHLLKEIAGPLVQAGRLETRDDIFMLTLPEVRRAVAGADLGGVARERRSSYEREIARRKLPRIVLSDGTEPEALWDPARPSSDGALTGTPASSGTVTARARVVLDPIGAKLLPGEILVAPSTDPGWTPLFLTAAGLVMEMGGAMSHGAVVARECGIPAVAGVAHATERIQTGQIITVDGSTGTIEIAGAGVDSGHRRDARA